MEPETKLSSELGRNLLEGCDYDLSTSRWYAPRTTHRASHILASHTAHPHRYLAAVSWSVQLITGTGGTGPYPNPNSAAETFVVTLLNISSAFLWTTVLAMFCDILTNSDRERSTREGSHGRLDPIPCQKDLLTPTYRTV